MCYENLGQYDTPVLKTSLHEVCLHISMTNHLGLCNQVGSTVLIKRYTYITQKF